MINIALDNESLLIRPGAFVLASRQESQLAFWGFTYSQAEKAFRAQAADNIGLLAKVLAYLSRSNIPYILDDHLRRLWSSRQSAAAGMERARDCAARVKNGDIDASTVRDFSLFLNRRVKRPLKEHQFKAALHLLAAQNGANFSVPGAGKTSVVLSVHQSLKEQGAVDSLFVVGPPACFAPWQLEYAAVLGASPRVEVLAAGDIDARRARYLVNRDSVADLYLTTFQTLQRDWRQVEFLFANQGIRFFLVVDEAHYIKQVGGRWATAVLNVARHAARRCVLTGTPFPQNYTDAFNLFDVLWPENPPIPQDTRLAIERDVQQNATRSAADALDAAIGPLFFRVRKCDLRLANQVFHPPIPVEMRKYERLVYDFIIDRVTALSQADYSKNLNLLMRLKRGRMIRLRQCVSSTALLRSAVREYAERLLPAGSSLAATIAQYDSLERPAKLDALLQLLGELTRDGRKVVVWANFIKTIDRICHALAASGHRAEIIYGNTPTENTRLGDVLTRDRIIAQFVDPASDLKILVANPAACAESVSLHKSCFQAVYYDLSYNCAQYLQSLDRIHRVGGSEKREAHYYFLQYANTIDGDILRSVRRKADTMSRVIDREYPICSLNMFAEDDEIQAYDRLFGKTR